MNKNLRNSTSQLAMGKVLEVRRGSLLVSRVRIFTEDFTEPKLIMSLIRESVENIALGYCVDKEGPCWLGGVNLIKTLFQARLQLRLEMLLKRAHMFQEYDLVETSLYDVIEKESIGYAQVVKYHIKESARSIYCSEWTREEIVMEIYDLLHTTQLDEFLTIEQALFRIELNIDHVADIVS